MRLLEIARHHIILDKVPRITPYVNLKAGLSAMSVQPDLYGADIRDAVELGIGNNEIAKCLYNIHNAIQRGNGYEADQVANPITRLAVELTAVDRS